MNSFSANYEDAFNLLCGKLLGSGIHRKVFECRIRPDLVVKVELADDDNWRNFANVFEEHFWDSHCYYKKVSDWLAPCEFLSPDGRILLQKKCDPVTQEELDATPLPNFLTDVKVENFGKYDGRIVCVDYAMTIQNPSVKLRKLK